ncbi:MAG: phosphotransferase family protein [Acidimicrobiales bacterium]
MSSAVHLITVEDGDSGRCQAVLRRYVRPEVNADQPDLAEREARTLGFVERLEVATPRLLALDPAGEVVGVPALLMTRVPGRVEWGPTDMAPWLRGLAELLPKIHSAPLPPPGIVGLVGNGQVGHEEGSANEQGHGHEPHQRAPASGDVDMSSPRSCPGSSRALLTVSSTRATRANAGRSRLTTSRTMSRLTPR